MGYVNTTEKLKLPQWRWTEDHPDFVPDINEAFAAIDKFARESGGDYDTLKQQVEALATNFVDIQEGFTALSEKVNNLEDLENNPEFQKVVTAVNELNTKVVDLEESVTNNTVDITEIKTRVSVLESDTSAIKSNIETINATLTDHGTRITNLETASSAQAGDITGLVTRVSTAEANIEANETAIENVNTRVNTTNTKVATIETSVNEAKNDITTVTARVGALEASQETQDTKIEGLEVAGEAVNSTIEQHATKLTELEAEDSALNARVGSVESKNITQDTEINGLDARVGALETQMPTIGARIVGGCYCNVKKNESDTNNNRYFGLTFYSNGQITVYLHHIDFGPEETHYILTSVTNTSGIINENIEIVGNTTRILIPTDFGYTNKLVINFTMDPATINDLQFSTLAKEQNNVVSYGAFNTTIFLKEMVTDNAVTADLRISEFLNSLEEDIEWI